MADPAGPDRRGHGSAWVTWIVVIMIIGLGIWLIFAWTAGPVQPRGGPAPGSGTPAPAAGTPGGAQPRAGTTQPATAPITDYNDLYSAGADWQAWVGRDVQIASAPVVQVVPGSGVFIGTNTRPLFVRVPRTGSITAGQNVSVAGAVERVPANAAAIWNVPPGAALRLNNQTIYVQATSVTPATQAGSGQPG